MLAWFSTDDEEERRGECAAAEEVKKHPVPLLWTLFVSVLPQFDC